MGWDRKSVRNWCSGAGNWLDTIVFTSLRALWPSLYTCKSYEKILIKAKDIPPLVSNDITGTLALTQRGAHVARRNEKPTLPLDADMPNMALETEIVHNGGVGVLLLFRLRFRALIAVVTLLLALETGHVLATLTALELGGVRGCLPRPPNSVLQKLSALFLI